ncbi:PREDICTED: uncharacterized protein LOC109170477 [Ipomoea nil]|uniref:uncharacterized protein LOC109170477 n=1 Tax=Ipomoea nil TaxID=35883 RepID=UPI0009008844|nr:PREDICTED: uncharacterized protein LOC109170477 [Ipomoea nil]XP_019175151.1 PREDICTED: uncharacterized protein LOC109170477 [Ipomoea nil]
MAICSSFLCGLGGGKKDTGDKKSLKRDDVPEKGDVPVPGKSSKKDDELKSTSVIVPVSFGISGSSESKVESPMKGEAEEVAYEGEDEHDESLSMKRDNSDFDLQAHFHFDCRVTDKEEVQFLKPFIDSDMNEETKKMSEEEGVEFMKSGNISDPGVGKIEDWASPRLMRSCSDLATKDSFKRIADQLLPSKSHQSFDEIRKLAEKLSEDVIPQSLGSPVSVMTHGSADKVLLKKHSSSQVLPSASRKLWWKLFLWSHRNLQSVPKPQVVLTKPALNQQGGYSSDTLEQRNIGSPGSFTGESLNLGNSNTNNQSWNGFLGASGLWPQNQWVAFPEESSSFSRVDMWVKELPVQPPLLIEKEDVIFPASPERSSSPLSPLSPTPNASVPEEVAHANNVIRSLNSSSTVALIAGTGLKVIPNMSALSSLRSVNLSANFIVHITPGSLPKGLHVLNLSRNKIATVEGLRELTRLRVLDLSYNKISRIGQGLSNCTLIKELYLAGNKISDVEGLHRLLKLTVLDVSFNKITTTKALGQLVANYNSLQALNLLGNPIQSNISDDQLRKTVCSLLPKTAFLNKQPINPQKAREVGTDAVAKAALGSGSRSSYRKGAKRVSQGVSPTANAHKNKHRSKTRTHHHSKVRASDVASSSR